MSTFTRPGAIEHGGHKVLALGHTDGKLSAETVREYVETFYADGNYTHMVFPGAVYISHPTEYGTLYTKAELAALHEVCAAYRIPLFLDGARLGYGLAAAGTDVTPARHCRADGRFLHRRNEGRRTVR